jgi:hypothetical protein
MRVIEKAWHKSIAFKSKNWLEKANLKLHACSAVAPLLIPALEQFQPMPDVFPSLGQRQYSPARSNPRLQPALHSHKKGPLRRTAIAGYL